MEPVIGVDEAGRGPVLGSMFVSAVRVSDRAVLPQNVRDSKALQSDEREVLANQIREVADDVAVVEVTPEEIDENPGQLNRLTIEASARAISSLLEDSATVQVIADACDVSETRYRGRLAALLPEHAMVSAMHGADASEPVVSAASILAKSARERHVGTLQHQFGTLGSGYPSDPATREFLKGFLEEHGTLPSCARHSWKTCRDLLMVTEQGSLADF